MPTIDEDARRRFEAAWQTHQKPRIEDYLPPADAATYLPTLEELIYIELELAWKRCGKDGGGPLVEGYWELFEELQESRELSLRLIKAEYEVRQDFGDLPSIEEYRRRFPKWIVTGRELTDAPKAPALPANLVQSLPAAGHVLVETIATADRKSSRYTLSRLHAEGGLGRIWVAHDVNLNRDVALKEIKPETTTHPEVWQRFLKEAQIAGQLEHPNIVPVYELARRPEDDQPFYTMRLVRGETLRDRIRDYHERKRGGIADPLELPRLLTAFVSICNAISFAHSKGVIHRDLKPENVVLGAFGEVLVLDWGLAKLQSDKEEATLQPVDITASANVHATKAGQVLGTPAYMSPEQAAGRISKMDARTDIYGLGAILFETLAGKPPHEGPDISELLSQIVLAPTPIVRAVDAKIHPALGAICAKAMERSQDDRYPTASALADDVQRFLADEPVSVYRAPLLDRAARFLRRHRTMALSGAAALLLVAIVASVAALLINEQKRLVTKAKENEESAHSETKGALAREAKALKASERELLKANANRLASQSQEVFEAQPQRALLMAVQAAELCQQAKEQEQPLVRQALLDHLSRVGGRVLGPITGTNSKPLELDLAAMSPDGKLVAAASAWRRHSEGQDPSGSKDVFLWSLSSDAPPKAIKLAGPKREIATLSFSPDGKLLAAACNDGHVYLWKTVSPFTIEPAATLPIPPSPPNLHPDDPIGFPEAKNVIFSGDGRWLAAFYRAGQVRVWKLNDGLPEKEPWLAAFPPEAGRIGTFQIPLPLFFFTPDQKRVLTVGLGDEWMLHVWNLSQKSASAMPEKSVPLGKQIIRSHALSPLGDKLAVGNMAGEVRVYSMSPDGVPAEPLVLRNQPGNKLDYNDVEGLAFSADGKWLVSSAAADLRLWNLEEANKGTPPQPHGVFPPGRRLTMDPQGTWFALSGDSVAGGVSEGRGIFLHDLPLLTANVQESPFTMHVAGSSLWVQGKDGRKEGRLLVSGPRSAETRPGITRLRGHQGMVVSLAADQQGQTFVSGGRDGMLRVWDVRQPEAFIIPKLVPQQWGLKEGVYAPQGAGMMLATVPMENDKSQVTLWDLKNEIAQPDIRLLEGFDKSRSPALGVSEDGKWIVRTAENHDVLLWDLTRTAPTPPRRLPNLPGYLFDQPTFRQPLQMSGGRRWVVGAIQSPAGGKSGKKVVVWDVDAADSLASRRTFDWQGDPSLIVLSPRGNWLAMAAERGPLLLHSLTTTTAQVIQVPVPKDSVFSLQFSADDQRLYIGCASGRFLIWDTTTRKIKAELVAHANPAISMLLSGDGKQAFTVAANESPRMWKLENGKPVSNILLPLEDSPAGDLAISPSGRWLVMAGGNNQPAVVWDLHAADISHSSVRLFRRWMPGDLVAGHVRFTSDSKQLITIGPTGARYWPLEMDDLIRLAKAAAGRSMTAAEKLELRL